MIIRVVIECYKGYVDLMDLAQSLDAFLQSQGYEVHEVATTILGEEEKDGTVN